MFIALAATGFAQPRKPVGCLNRIGQKEWAILLKELPADNRTQLFEDAAFREHQVENLRQFLAVSCAAMKEGAANDPVSAAELAYIRSESFAVEYDARFKQPPSSERFTRITDAQISSFYKLAGSEKDFNRFLEVKTAILRRNNPAASVAPTKDEIDLARKLFAKIRISEKAALLQGEPFRSTADFKARLQQAQFLARLYAESIVADAQVSDADVSDYIAKHPEFDSSSKRAVAAKLLDRIKAGDDFAALANEFSEDPGNTDTAGKKNGGRYANVGVGVMVPPFEKAALSLQPGQVFPTLVETDFGYHIVKLEKRSGDGSTYDVRHILIGTGFPNPNDPTGRPVPAAMLVRSKLETQREAAVIDEILKKYPVVIEEPVAAPVVSAKTRPIRKKR